MFRGRIWILAFLLPLSFLSACTRSLPVSIRVTLPTFPVVPFEIYSEGRKVDVAVSGEPGDRSASFSAEGRLRGDQFKLPPVTMRLHYPCGWREEPLTLDSNWAPEYVRKSAEEHQTLAISGDTSNQTNPAPMSIDVDNRGGEAHSLEVGELSYAVAGKELTHVDTYQPDCGNASLGINGKAIGSLPAATKPADPTAYRKGAYVFVDPTAKRCYQVRAIVYGTDFPDSGPRVVETLKGRQFYVLEDAPDYVFTTAPGSIMSQVPVESRLELTEKNCR
jgi:hypothetical protein